MKAKRTTPIISWALGLLTIFVLVLNIPNQLDDVLGLWLLFVGLTALALNLGVLLSSGQISPAHVFAIMAFLTMGRSGQAAEAIWAVAVGSLLGGLVQVARKDEWLPHRRDHGPAYPQPAGGGHPLHSTGRPPAAGLHGAG